MTILLLSPLILLPIWLIQIPSPSVWLVILTGVMTLAAMVGLLWLVGRRQQLG